MYGERVWYGSVGVALFAFARATFNSAKFYIGIYGNFALLIPTLTIVPQCDEQMNLNDTLHC